MTPVIEAFSGLPQRRDEIRACGTAAVTALEPNLRDFIETEAGWWPVGCVTDGCDHSVLPSSPAERVGEVTPELVEPRSSSVASVDRRDRWVRAADRAHDQQPETRVDAPPWWLIFHVDPYGELHSPVGPVAAYVVLFAVIAFVVAVMFGFRHVDQTAHGQIQIAVGQASPIIVKHDGNDNASIAKPTPIDALTSTPGCRP